MGRDRRLNVGGRWRDPQCSFWPLWLTHCLDWQTAEEYESFASRVLQRAQKECKDVALTWLVARRQATAGLAAEAAGIDLVVAGGCETLIEECGVLCIDAVQVG